MTPAWLRRAIEAKRDGAALDGPSWARVVAEYTVGALDEAPVAALLMAATIRGLDDAETVALTEAMVASGETLAFAIPTVDKHSSGGVGDTVSLIVVPLVAACGVAVAKLSGHALGHTGGTLNKLEAIPGVRTGLSPDAFQAQIGRIGCAIAAQSAHLDPADKKLYALRDRTGSVPCIGLIVASIVSKKIAGGADGIVFDVKVGNGSFMRTEAQARELAERLVRMAAHFGRRSSALVTAMDEPLGLAVGNELEVIAAREFLAGRARDPRLADVVDLVALEMLRVGGIAEAEARTRLQAALQRGAAYEKFVTMLVAQGGSRATLEGLSIACERTPVVAPRDGYVAAINAVGIGEAARQLGERLGGSAGILMHVRIGDAVRRGDVLAEIIGEVGSAAEVAAAFTLSEHQAAVPPLFVARVRDELGSAANRSER
jgi:pyrimidine-nucleoside phosphorylase